MPSLNFQARFARLVESGVKRQTIRANRKRPFYLNDTLYLYTGMRRPGARLLKTAPCKEVLSIEIRLSGEKAGSWVDGKSLGCRGRQVLAQADGFASVNDLVEWFQRTHGLSESNDSVDREDLRLQIDTDDVILRWWNVGIITFYFPDLDRLPVTNVVWGIRKKAFYANRIAAVKTMQD